MGHPAIENATPFAFEPLFLSDEEGRPLLVPVVKATYVLEENALVVGEVQRPVAVAGEFWGDPEQSSYKYEPECAPVKLTTDVALIGHAHGRGAPEVLVALQVGPLRKAVRVVSDRLWYKTLGTVSMTRPQPFDTLPLQWERAFGGWDRSHPDPRQHQHEPRNPVGVGFRASSRHFEEGLRLPNLEEPAQPLGSFGQRVPPAGFGFTSPHWEPRSAFAGTYDDAWAKERLPLLPKDFDRRFFNAAAPGLVAPAYLRGDEPVTVVNASPRGRLRFDLPGVPPPEVTVQLFEGEDARPPMRLDTVILNTDIHEVYLLWRGQVPLSDGPHDVKSIRVTAEGISSERAEPVESTKGATT